MSSVLLRRWEYRDTAALPPPLPTRVEPQLPEPVSAPPPGITEEQVAARVTLALAEAEQRWAASAEEEESRRRDQFLSVLQSFAAERARYFREVETEVVQLALSIARKILGREANLDPELLVALVRIALDRMGAGPVVRVRVPAADLRAWQKEGSLIGNGYVCEVAADDSLRPGDCFVETDLGSANFGFDAQFKEIEEGMLDLLRLRPQKTAPETADKTTEHASRSRDDR